MGMKILITMLYPFAFIYGLIVRFRNILFDKKVLKQQYIPLPSIGVGNLSSGGTGKSVVIDYLITLLKKNYPIVVLSRGYKRKTKGVVVSSSKSTAATIGDEPYQFLKKHSDISVVVAEKRVLGIQKIKEFSVPNSVILLDDIMQHRYVKPSLLILTTTYEAPFFLDRILPVGSLRESKKGAKRAAVILVTKCPDTLNHIQMNHFKEELILEKHQQLFFTKIQYSNRIVSNSGSQYIDQISQPFVLVTGIADPKPLVEFLKEKAMVFEHLSFPDHHIFKLSEIDQIQKLRAKGIVLTTEKDYTRLSPLMNESELYYLPITMAFVNSEDQIIFDETIQKTINQF